MGKPMSAETKAKLSAALRAKWASGTRKENARSVRGQEVIGGKNGRGTDNWKSKFWILWSPQRDLVCGVNLNEIVRRNAHLFAVEDLRSHGSGTVASHGLNELFRFRKGRNGAKYIVSSWKGWRAVDRAEMVKAVEVPKGYIAMWKPDLEYCGHERG